MSITDVPPPNESWRDRVTLGLMILGGIAVLGSVANSIPSIGSVGPALDARIEAGIGAVFFTLLFVLLGFRPRQYPFVFEFVILHRVALGAFGIVTSISGAMAAMIPALTDIAIATIVVAAYAFGRGYDAW